MSRLKRLYESADRRALALTAVDALNRLLESHETGPTVTRGAGVSTLGPQPAGSADDMPQELFQVLDGAREALEEWISKSGLEGD